MLLFRFLAEYHYMHFGIGRLLKSPTFSSESRYLIVRNCLFYGIDNLHIAGKGNKVDEM